MKKLYKKSFHTVLYLEEKDALNKACNLMVILSKFCGLSESKLEEVKCVEDLPDGWNTEESPTTNIRVDGEDFEFSYDIIDDTIEEILQDTRLNSLEEENKKLKEENQRLRYLYDDKTQHLSYLEKAIGKL